MAATPSFEADLLPESKYTIALERQLEALHFVRSYKPFNSVARHVMQEELGPAGLRGVFKNDFTMDTAVAEALARAVPYFWGDGMWDVILKTAQMSLDGEAAASTRLLQKPLKAGDLPDECGYVWFETPLPVISGVEGDPELLRAMVWEPVAKDGHQGYMITAFTGYPPDQNLGLPSMNLAHGTPRTPLNWRIGETLSEFLLQIGLQYENPVFRGNVRAIAGMPAAMHRRQMQHFAVVFASLVEVLNQRITRVAGARGDRASRRRAQALLGKPDVPTTRVVLLRPVDYVATGEPSEPGDPVNWSHRWEVRRHQRRQRVGPGRSQVKLVWVESYVKGPAGKPLITPLPIKAVVR